MSIKPQNIAHPEAESAERLRLGKLLLQILPRRSGQAKTEEFKEKLRKEFGEAAGFRERDAPGEMERTARFLLAQLQKHGTILSNSSGPSRKTDVFQSRLSSQGRTLGERCVPQHESLALHHFRFEHPAIITQRLRRLPAKSLEVELTKLTGEVARQVRFLIWHCDNGQTEHEGEQALD